MITLFFPVFLILLLNAFRSPKHWFFSSVLAATFQAASPFVLAGGGRAIGINGAYLLLAAGAYHFFTMRSIGEPGKQQTKLPVSYWIFIFFVVYGVGGALLWPSFFSGSTLVLSPRYGLDSGFLTPLSPSSGNLIQAFYLLCNFFLVTFSFYAVRCGQLTAVDIFKSIKFAFVIVLAFGFYQVFSFQAGLPWPQDLVNSNVGIAQSFEQTVMGIKRMSSTFQEPSMMAMHLLALVAAIYVKGDNTKLLWLGLLALILSTSSIAYVGLGLGLFCLVLLGLSQGNLKFLLVAVSGVLVLCLSFAFDHMINDGQLARILIFEKLDSGSGAARTFADHAALENVADTYGFGVGVGSTRASSLLTTLLATTGVWGFLSLFSVVACAAWPLLRASDVHARAMATALLTLLISASLGVPDFSMPLIWLLLGAAMAKSAHIEGNGGSV